MKTYQTPFGAIPSVTAILQETLNPEAKEKLRKWQHKQDQIHGAGASEKISAEARERGNKIHKLIETYINRNVKPFAEPDEPFEFWHREIKIFLNTVTHKDAIAIEKFMFCEKYGGTVDLIANINNEQAIKVPTIIDWKTSHRIKQRAWMEDAFIQCAAYAQLTQNQTETIQQLMVCVISPNKLQIFSEENLQDYYDKWNQRLNQFYEQQARM